MRRLDFGGSLVKLIILSGLLVSTVNADPFASLQESYRQKFGDTTAVSVRNLRTGEELFHIGGNSPMLPASCLKLFTTYGALKLLGGEYVFPTEFFLSSGDRPILTVRGHGDPTLTEERLYKIADDLYRAGIRELGGLNLDNSLFEDPRPRSGLNPYEAANTALPVNFNTINVRAQVVGDKIVTSTSSFVKQGLSPALSVNSGSGTLALSEALDGRIIAQGKVASDGAAVEDSISVSDPEALFGEIFSGILSLRGIKLSGKVSKVRVSPASQLFLLSKSKELSQILIDLNRYSSNFIAGQLIYALGKREALGGKEGGNYSFELGLKRLADFFLSEGFSRNEVVFFDGSGLDRRNRSTASALTKLIARAASDPEIAPDFFATLPRFGKRGTLKRRSVSPELDATIWGKTGYLSGVESIAGTFPLAKGELGAYAIVTNGPGNKDEVNRMEERILRDLVHAALAASATGKRSAK